MFWHIRVIDVLALVNYLLCVRKEMGTDKHCLQVFYLPLESVRNLVSVLKKKGEEQ